MATSSRLTIDDFERLPAEEATGHELIDGELVDVTGNIFDHNWLRDRLVKILSAVVEERRLGLIVAEQEFNFDGNAHGPDVIFVSAGNESLIDRRKRVQVAELVHYQSA